MTGVRHLNFYFHIEGERGSQTLGSQTLYSPEELST